VIEKIHIQNFKCLRDVTVELGPFNVLIGPNDSGKSSLFQAIVMMRGLAPDKFPATPIQIPFVDTMIWQRKPNLKVMIRVQGIWQGRDSLVLELPLTPEFNKYLNMQALGKSGSLMLAKHLASTASYRLNPSSLRLSSAPQYSAVLRSDGSNLASVLHGLLSGPDRATVLELERKLNEAIPTLSGISTPLVEGKNSYRVEFTLNTKSKPPISIPSVQASDGAMLLLAYLVLVYGDAPDILLIEEPENGLHPSRLKMVIDILRKISTGEIGYKPRQVILTTHSPLLLNFVKPEEVRIFDRDEEGATHVTPMNKVPDIDRLQKEYAPGELWYLFGEEDLIKGLPT
jgi:predicted ATPase